MKVISEVDNKLFNRKEVVLEVEAEVTPSNSEVLEMLGKQYSGEEGRIRIKKIEGRFGSKVFKVFANIYNTKKDFDEFVKKTKQEKEAEKKAEEERLKAEATAKEEAAKPAEEVKEEEKPVEAKTEEVKPEVKE
jgi:ribosomal protein S24E